MFMVVIGTFGWSSSHYPQIPLKTRSCWCRRDGRLQPGDGGLWGVIVSVLIFAWSTPSFMSSRDDPDGSRTYELNGPLFFRVHQGVSRSRPANDPDDVSDRVPQLTGGRSLGDRGDRQRSHIRGSPAPSSSEPRVPAAAARRGMVEVNVLEDPSYHVADDELA
ncbi:MAG: hypothetical protein R3B67_11795 [Phycisphaerales bacterium]